MAARTRRVVWAQSAQKALGEVIGDIASDSHSGAIRLLTVALETADSLSTLAERGRVVPEVGDPALRELFVFDYRLLYRVYDDRVVIRFFTALEISLSGAARKTTSYERRKLTRASS